RVCSRVEEPADGSVGNLRGHVSGPVPSHAVGDDVQVVLLEDHEGIFVVLPLETDIAHARCDCPHKINGYAEPCGPPANQTGVKHSSTMREGCTKAGGFLIPP